MIGLTGAKLALLATILVALGACAAQAATTTDAAPPDCAGRIGALPLSILWS